MTFTIDFLLYAQAVAPNGSRAKRVLKKAISFVDAKMEIPKELVTSIKASVKKIQYEDRRMILEKKVKEWSQQDE